MSPRCAALALLSITACGATPAAPGVVLLPQPAAAASSAPPVAGPPEPSPPGLDTVGEMGCVFPSSRRLPLRFRPGAPPFASLQGASALMDLSTAGPEAGASARAVREGFTLNGIVAADDVALAPTRAMVLGGFIVPTAEARFAWKGTSAGRIRVALPLDPLVHVLPEAHLDATTELPCDAVSFDDTTFDELAAAPRSPKQHDATWRTGTPIPLTRTPGRPQVAVIAPRSDPDELVTVVETRGRHALVVWARQDAVLFGWVPSTLLLPATHDWVKDQYSNGIGLVGTGKITARAVVHCDHELALVAEVAGERRTVESIAAGTPLRLGEERGAVVPLVLPETLALAEADARLGVLASQVAVCEQGR